MRIRFKLDGNLVTTPYNYRGMEIVHKRDEVLRGLMYGFNASLTFVGDGYDYLRQQFLGGVCGTVDCDIEIADNIGPFTLFAEARIILNEIEWDTVREQALSKLTDRSFNSLISTNKSIKAYLGVPLDKLKGDISGKEATPIDIEVFDPDTGAYLANPRKFYKVYDCLRSIVAFMTEGTVEFDSVTFGVGGAYEFYALTTGLNLRDDTSEVSPYISFDQLVGDLAKLFNLTFYIKFVSGVPTIFIEVEDDTFSDTSSTAIGGMYGLKQQLDETRFYAKVDVGGTETQDDDGGTYLYPDVRLMSHKREEYQVQINCNVDTTLNLVYSNLIADTNIFDHLLRVDTGDDSYDDDVFIMNYYESFGNLLASQFTLEDSGGTVIVYYYNDYLLNERVLNRWTKWIPEGLGSFFDASDYTCESTSSSAIISAGIPGIASWYSPGQINLNIDINDPSGVFNTTDSVYEVPAAGIYTFSCNARLMPGPADDYGPGIASGNRIVSQQFVFKRYDSTLTTVLDEECLNRIFVANMKAGPIRLLDMWATFYCETGDKVGVWCEAFTGEANYGSGTGFTSGGFNVLSSPGDPTYDVDLPIFRCTWFNVGGGTVLSTPSSDIRSRSLIFDKHITQTKYEDIVSLPLAAIATEVGDDIVPAWVDEMRYNPSTGMTSFKLITENT